MRDQITSYLNQFDLDVRSLEMLASWIKSVLQM